MAQTITTASHGVPSEEGLVRIGEGCSLNCTFCPHSRGRSGTGFADITEEQLPVARRITILAGDVLTLNLGPKIRHMRNAGASSVYVYAHPGLQNVEDTLDHLVKHGMTGLHLMLPAASREMMAKMTGGLGFLGRTAALIKAANKRDLKIALEVPVVEASVGELEDTVGRALNIIKLPERIILRYLSEFDPAQGALPWDISSSVNQVQAVMEIAKERMVPVTFSDAPPPCVLNMTNALPGLYPNLGRAGSERPFVACQSCAVASVCMVSPRFAKLNEPEPIIATDLRQSEGQSSVALFLRQVKLTELKEQFKAQRPICRFPWEALEAHDIRGVVTPCAGGWPLPEITQGCESWHNMGLLEAWNSPGMQAIRRSIAMRRPQESCKADCPAFHGGPQSNIPAYKVPATKVMFDNIVLNIEEMLAGVEELRSKPQTISFSPTLRCPNECRMCDIHKVRKFMGDGPEFADMPDRLYDELLELLPTTRMLAVTGGEPLMSRRMRELLREFDATKFPDGAATLTTNGLLLGKPVLRDLAKTPIQLFYVSLNAVDDEMYELVSGGTKRGFTKVVANVKRLLEAAVLMPSRPSVILSFVVQRSNWMQLPAFLDLANSLGTGVRLLPIERDRLGESIFTEEALLRQVLTMIQLEVLPRLPKMPWGYRNETQKLLSVIEGRLERQIWTPL